MAQMTSRQRAMAALNHQEGDRLPIDIGSTNVSGIHAVAQHNLSQALGLPEGEPEWMAYAYQIARPSESIRRRFAVDFYGLVAKPVADWQRYFNAEENSYVDEWGIKYAKPAESYYFDMVFHPLAEASTVEEVAAYPMPDPRDPARFAGLAEKAKDLYENTDYALVINGPMGSCLFQLCAWLTGLENHLVNTVTNQEFVVALLDRLLEFHLAFWDKMLDEVGPYVQVVAVGDDLGAQNGPLFNPKTYRKLCKEAHRKLYSFIKSKADVKILFHSCGSVYQFIPDLVEVGVDALNPVQYQTKDMDTARLKSEFGDKLTFWGGGCETQYTLPQGTPEEVREEVRRRIADLAPGGGFVFNPVHNIQADVPVQNIVTLLDSALEFGRYR